MKKIDIAEIKSGSLLGQPEKVAVQIKLGDEDAEFETYVKPFSYDTAVAHLRAFGEKKESLAGILASCICDDSGTLEFSEDDIRTKFPQSLVEAIWSKVIEVNVMGKTQSSNPKRNSFVKSQSLRVKASKKSKSLHTQKSKSGQPTSENMEALTSAEE
ncbi:phage tail assembly chaperone family protein, TAC [Acinetobacter sp. ANC 3791]|uniref:phage tail assembly chaperone family protein, TAC n=1 Tax=Acinetobacter sp. ANC 3791 TaxID=2529836 RepID=UPI001039B825|nr:phage tail assembly chaperone family protein, TAC [Acinetobacter sp. ANC 3791]TCB83329.1 hypothetical protein E0H90_11410 [Acinetobacter sp. ANC 3791]